MNTRKTYITKMGFAFGISFLLMLWAISTADAMQNRGDDPYRIEEFSINTPGELEVQTSGGHITVEGTQNNSVRVEMFVSKDGESLSPSDTDLEDFDITIEQQGSRIRAIAKHEGNSGWKFWENNDISVSFVVYTPREMSTRLKTSGGHIKTAGLTGTQDMKTSGGHLELADLEGTINARTSGGHIDINNITGDVEARTSGGHIDARNTEGTLNVRTSGGHIDLENIAGAVEASTSGGSIAANISKMGEFARLKTSGGNVDITVPRNIGLDLDLRGSRVRTQLENFSGSMEDDDVEGSINGGGPMLSARTSGGTVRVSFK
ncbi:MAG: DUF4097 family beta strand repeat protein [Balneolaceae bacterium]|nr:DUF4097 family beta strand repeat protein [Balneolaceae bacterium]